MNAREILWEANRIRRELMDRHPEHAATLVLIHFQASNRMTSTAGIARKSKNLVKLSVPFFSSPANAGELRKTVVHEIAHVLAPAGEKHGPRWRAIDISLGGNGTRCHAMEELGVGFKKRERKPTVQAPCPKCGKPMTLGPTQLKRHNAIVEAYGSGYTHWECRPK